MANTDLTNRVCKVGPTGTSDESYSVSPLGGFATAVSGVMSEDDLATLEARVELEKGLVEAFQADYNKALEELRVLLRHEADLQPLTDELDAYAHSFE